jgi:hypothetical protein
MNLSQKDLALLQELRSAIINHDWWYHMTDDPRVYQKGKAEKANITYLMAICKSRNLDLEAQAIWKTHKPKDIYT